MGNESLFSYLLREASAPKNSSVILQCAWLFILFIESNVAGIVLFNALATKTRFKDGLLANIAILVAIYLAVVNFCYFCLHPHLEKEEQLISTCMSIYSFLCPATLFSLGGVLTMGIIYCCLSNKYKIPDETN